VEDGSDSDEEVLAGSEQKLEEGQGGSPRSFPAQRTLGVFLGNDWKLVTAAGRRRGGNRYAFAPGGRCAGISARAARSVEKKISGAMAADEFPPLPAPVVVAPCPPLPLCEVRVGSVMVPLTSSTVAEGYPVASAPMLGTEKRGPPVRGDVEACRPLVDAVVVDPAGQTQQRQCDTDSGLFGPFSVQSWHSSSSAQAPHPTAPDRTT
jgi:hypothetical protein